MRRGAGSVWVVSLVVVVAVAVVGWRVTGEVRKKMTLYKSEKILENGRKKSEEDFQKLLREQEARGRLQAENSDTIRKAKGKYTLNVVLVRPPRVPLARIEALTARLRDSRNYLFSSCIDSDCQKTLSLNYLSTYYRDQAAKYGVYDFDLAVKVIGPTELDGLNKVGDLAYDWGKDPFGVTKLEDKFGSILEKENVSTGERDLTVFLYFDDSFDKVSSQSDDRFYEHKKFRSFANDETGRVYINAYDLNPEFSNKVVEIAAHEILHLFGATDKYEESESVSRICSVRGQGEVDRVPSVPQVSGDIMCMFVEKENDKFDRGSFVDGELVVNRYTAEEIGWK